MRLEPYVSSAPVMSIVEPREDETVPIEGAIARRIVLDDAGYLEENPGSRLTLVFDGDAVRDVTDVRAPLALGGLLADAREISSGSHALVAVLVGPRGDALRFGPNRRVVASVRRFFVGSPSPHTPPPMLVFLTPRGTLNGPAGAKSALLDFVVLGESAGVFRVNARIAGPSGTSTAVLPASGPYALRGLGNGDYRFDLELGTDRRRIEGPWAHATRTITVNLDVAPR